MRPPPCRERQNVRNWTAAAEGEAFPTTSVYRQLTERQFFFAHCSTVDSIRRRDHDLREGESVQASGSFASPGMLFVPFMTS